MLIENDLITSVTNRRNALNAEQVLCQAAIQSGDYDAVSDAEWIALCERAAQQGRVTGTTETAAQA